MKAQQMARCFATWYPLITFGDQAAQKALGFFQVTDDGFWRNVAGIIRAEGKNRKERRKHKQRSSPVNA